MRSDHIHKIQVKVNDLLSTKRRKRSRSHERTESKTDKERQREKSMDGYAKEQKVRFPVEFFLKYRNNWFSFHLSCSHASSIARIRTHCLFIYFYYSMWALISFLVPSKLFAACSGKTITTPTTTTTDIS